MLAAISIHKLDHSKVARVEFLWKWQMPCIKQPQRPIVLLLAAKLNRSLLVRRLTIGRKTHDSVNNNTGERQCRMNDHPHTGRPPK